MGSDVSSCEKMEPAESVVRDESSQKPSLKAQVQSSGKMLRDHTCCFLLAKRSALFLVKTLESLLASFTQHPQAQSGGPVFSTEHYDCLMRVSIAVMKHCDHKASCGEKVYLAYTSI